jgi:TRAP transporter TAXI family solute receptor
MTPGAPEQGETAAHQPTKITAVSLWALAQTLGPVILVAAVAIWGTLHFVQSAPPRSITISTGPPGSTFETIAERYAKLLARSGVTLKVLQSKGSMENLARLSDRTSHVDIALVQAGLSQSDQPSDLVSLGGMFYQPVTIFYRGQKPLSRLSDFRGQRIAIGPEGSGTRFLALALLKANEIDPQGPTRLLSLEGDAAREALLRKEVDVVFLTGDSASPLTIREMLHAEGILLFDFPQADAYVRRFPYLNKLVLPPGAFDLGENLPPTEVNLLAPTVELVSHSDLHPAIVDLLVEAAFQVHGRATLLQAAGQFPNPSMRTLPLDEEAGRYYKSGDKTFTYRYLPFWLASLVNRAAVVLLPILVVVVPGLRFLPQMYRWRIDSRIHHRYTELMSIEREALGKLTEERRAVLLKRLREMERSVISRKMPGSHAEQLYQLRQHIEFVREGLSRSGGADEERALA